MIKHKHPFVIGLILLMSLFLCREAYAQPSAGRFGLGIQFGKPSGLSMRVFQPGKMSVDILLAWDLDDFFYANVHGTWEKPIGGTQGKFHFFYGPGVFVGLKDERRDRQIFDGDDEVNLGVSGTIGLNVYIERIEIYLRLTPRMQIYDHTEAAFGGGLGFRFYL